MKRVFAYICLVVVALVGTFVIGCCFGNRHVEVATTAGEMHIIGTWADFDYSVLGSIDSKDVDVARRMLEKDIFVNLQEMWVNSKENGDIADPAIRKHFLKLYPALRNRVPLSLFERFPLPIQNEMKAFVTEADKFVASNRVPTRNETTGNQ